MKIKEGVADIDLLNKRFKFQHSNNFTHKRTHALMKKEIEKICKENKHDLKAAFRSIIWMTYRKDFKPLLNESKILHTQITPNTKICGFTTDAGWGCMIR